MTAAKGVWQNADEAAPQWLLIQQGRCTTGAARSCIILLEAALHDNAYKYDKRFNQGARGAEQFSCPVPEQESVLHQNGCDPSWE
jgi:hypothetical protein